MIWQDTRYAFRTMRNKPAFTATAVLSLALGIGANTATFSVVNAVLLKPARFADPDRTVWLATTTPTGPDYSSSDPKFNLWKQQTSVLEDVTGQAYAKMNLTGVEFPEQIETARVTSAYFRLLGMRIARGRSFTAEEDRTGGPNVAVISDGFWKRHFGGDPTILGGKIWLAGAPFEVVGIAAPGVETEAQIPPEVWVPLEINPGSTSQVQYFLALARLKPGIGLAMARAQLQIAAEEYRRKFPNTVTLRPGYTFDLTPVREAMVGYVRPSLLVLMGAVSLVLLIACANAANLLLIRATGRVREMAIRAAMGAQRRRLIGQLLTESVVLSIAAGVLGFLLGILGIRSLLALNPTIPRIGDYGYHVGLDWRVIGFTAAVALATGIVFGVWPALAASRVDMTVALKEGSGRLSAGLRSNKIRSVLVAGEMALALILSVGAALLIRSFVALRQVHPGFDAKNVLTLHMSLAGLRFQKTQQVNEFVRLGGERLSSQPEIIAAGCSSWLPFETGATLPFAIVGRPLIGPSHGPAHWRDISPAYFDALKIPLLRGRLFNDRDDGKAARVVIINQALARQYWPHADAIGQQIVIAPNVGPEFDEPPRQIVGIVGDIHDDALNRDPLPTMYVPIAQVTDGRMLRIRENLVWIVRTRVAAPIHDCAAGTRTDTTERRPAGDFTSNGRDPRASVRADQFQHARPDHFWWLRGSARGRRYFRINGLFG